MCELLDKYVNQGESQMLVKAADALVKNFSLNLRQACESIGSTVEEYRLAKNNTIHNITQ